MLERRRTPRAPLADDELFVDLRIEARGLYTSGRLVDASELGFQVELSRPSRIVPGEQVHVTIRDEGAARRLGCSGQEATCVVRRSTATLLGVEAPEMPTELREDLADLVWERREYVRAAG